MGCCLCSVSVPNEHGQACPRELPGQTAGRKSHARWPPALAGVSPAAPPALTVPVRAAGTAYGSGAMPPGLEPSPPDLQQPKGPSPLGEMVPQSLIASASKPGVTQLRSATLLSSGCSGIKSRRIRFHRFTFLLILLLSPSARPGGFFWRGFTLALRSSQHSTTSSPRQSPAHSSRHLRFADLPLDR